MTARTVPNWLLALLAAIPFLSVVNHARSHSFYPVDCCSNRDCSPLDPARISPAPGGYRVDGDHFVAEKDARPSPDKHYHGCFPIATPWQLKCFWAPKPSM